MILKLTLENNPARYRISLWVTAFYEAAPSSGSKPLKIYFFGPRNRATEEEGLKPYPF
jgi:hypothetical protein